MKGAMHIVQVLDIHDNPLQRPGTEELPVIEGHWVILEYLENGSIEKFINNTTESLRTRLPNRLLWRFFLCCKFYWQDILLDVVVWLTTSNLVIKACIAMTVSTYI